MRQNEPPVLGCKHVFGGLIMVLTKFGLMLIVWNHNQTAQDVFATQNKRFILSQICLQIRFDSLGPLRQTLYTL